MTPTTHAEQETRDFTVPNGCALCGGNVAVRVSEDGAGSICESCHFIARPKLTFEKDGMQLEMRFSAQA